MNPYSAFDQIVQNAQRQFEVCQPSLALREWERMDRQLRDSERIHRMTSDMDRISRVTRETEFFREGAATAMSLQSEKLQFQENLAARAEAMRVADSQWIVNSFIRIQQDLARDAMRTVEQNRQFVSQINDAVLKQVEFARTILEGFNERIFAETALRDGLVSSLVSAYRTIPSDLTPVTTNYDELLDRVIRGFEETKLTHPEADYQTIIWRFDHWLATFPPHVLFIIINLVIGILIQVMSQYGSHSCKCETKALPEVHESHGPPAAPERADARFDMCQ